jgi:hypothetical protein
VCAYRDKKVVGVFAFRAIISVSLYEVVNGQDV